MESINNEDQYDNLVNMLVSAEGHIRRLQDMRNFWLESDEEMYGRLIESQKTLSQIIGHGEEGYEPFFFELPFTLDTDIAFNDRYISREPFQIIKSGEEYIVKDLIFQETPEVKNRWDKLHFLMPDSDHPITRRFYHDNIVLWRKN